MRRQRFLTVGVVSLVLLGPAAMGAEQVSKHDKQVIITLLDRLKQRKDLHFIRDGKVYDAHTAAWYLHFKWDQNKDKVHSIEDFIQLSSVGGEHGEITYYVKFSDGRTQTAREVLEASVKQIEAE